MIGDAYDVAALTYVESGSWTKEFKPLFFARLGSMHDC